MFPRQSALRLFSQQLPKCSRISRPQFCNPTWRHFTSSAPRTKTAKPQSPQRPQFTGRRPEGLGLFEQKVAKTGDIVLFKAPSHRLYIFGAYSLAFLAFAMAGYNAHITFQDPLGPLPTWIKASSAVVSIIASTIGTMLVLKTGRLVNSVHAFRSKNHTVIRVSVRRMIPFLKPLEFDLQPRQVSITNRVVGSPHNVKQHLHARPSWFRSPLAATSHLSWRIFKTVRQIATEEDFITLRLEGQRGRFRMDANGDVSKDVKYFASGVLDKY